MSFFSPAIAQLTGSKRAEEQLRAQAAEEVACGQSGLIAIVMVTAQIHWGIEDGLFLFVSGLSGI